MTTRSQRLAALVQLPRQGLTLSVESTATTAWVDLQAEVDDLNIGGRPGQPWCGCFLALQADGGDVYIALTKGAASPDNDLDVSAFSAGAGNPDVNGGMRIPDGQVVHAWVEAGHYRYLAHATATGSATLRIWPSSRQELFGLSG